MKKSRIGIMGSVAAGILLAVVLGMYILRSPHDIPQGACTKEAMFCPDGSAVGRTGPACAFAPCPDLPKEISTPELVPPLDRAKERVTKKPFGIFIDPQTSPVQPERFRGYHTGTDFETFPDESASDVAVHAACAGTLGMKQHVSGYGGILVERCVLDGKSVSIVYGHIALGSVTAQVGDALEQGSLLGVLGAARSADTDGERKHLHFGIFKGGVADIRGYVASQQELKQWSDPCLFVCTGKNE
ncbi:MAG: M23 family metallopeptidase [Candidatus Moraniibacteriota bacterium]